MFLSKISICIFALGTVVLFGSSTEVIAQANVSKIRSFNDVKAIAHAHFKSEKGFKEGDLITQSMTIRLFQRLEKFGWRVSDAREVVELTLPDGDFLVKTFKTSKGRAFLAKIARHPEAIDRADRMVRMPNGKKNITDLVQKIPNGADLIVSLASKKNGQQVSKRMAGTKHGRNFNKPTGRFYQLENLVERLQISYEKAQTQTVRKYRDR